MQFCMFFASMQQIEDLEVGTFKGRFGEYDGCGFSMPPEGAK